MVAALCRHADIDPDDDDIPLAGERDRLRRPAKALADDAATPPTAILDSGNGLRRLWAVAREPLTPKTLARVEAEHRAVEAALGASGTHDVSRLLRLPGTVNFPNRTELARGRGIAQARVVFQVGQIYRPEDAARLAGHIAAALAGKGVLRGVRTVAGASDTDGADPVLDRLHRANGALAARCAGDTAGLRDGIRSALAMALWRRQRRARIAPALGKGDRGRRRARRAALAATESELATADGLPAPRLNLADFPDPWPRWIARAAEGAGAPPDYVACVGLPSAGKSPAIDAVAGPLAALAGDLNDDSEDRVRAYRTARQEAKERRALWGGMSKRP